MSGASIQDAYLLEKVVDPNSQEFEHLLHLLMTNPAETELTRNKLSSKAEFRFTLPYRGDPEDEVLVREITPFKFPERSTYRNGVASLATSAADLVDLLAQASGKHRMSSTVCVSNEHESLRHIMASAGTVSTLIHYCGPDDLVAVCLQVKPDTLIFDHTTVCAPVDQVLSIAHRLGIRIVDGVFPYHVAAMRGWDTVAGVGKWSVTHSGKHVVIGPDDDPLRLLKYNKHEYEKFVNPTAWKGLARHYGYELRKHNNCLVSYRGVYLAGKPDQIKYDNSLMFDLPMCSSDDMVMVTINRDLAAGVFVSQSNNAQDLARLDRNYAIEVRRELFVSCVDYLIAKDKNTDIVGDSVRYITEHNYVDLVDGVRVIRCPSLSYGDALCVAMVCSLTAFSLRYRLTNESLSDIRRQKDTARLLNTAPFGGLGRLVWSMFAYISDATSNVAARAISNAKQILYSSDYIPGVCFDVYTSVSYTPDLDWFEPSGFVIESNPDYSAPEPSDDPLVQFLAETQKTSAPTALREHASVHVAEKMDHDRYQHTPIDDVATALQEVYDQALPGNSTAQLANVFEARKTRDVDFHTEFYGRIEINKDIPVNEQLHRDAPIRTAALPISRTSLVDAILASAKRNFNPPDLQMQNDPWEYAKYLTDKFMNFAFGDRFQDTLGKAYKKDPITFNVQDYLEWRASRDKSYLTALEAECPNELVELNLEKYDTIIKKRIKPKLSTSAQYELAQPQVIVSLSKKDTAPFTSVFRKMFERLDNALRPEVCSAGRLSDADISSWLTRNMAFLLAFECFEIDSSKYDKSQGLLARMVESLVLVELGLDPNVSKIFEDSYVGKVSSRILGLMFVSAYQMKSGGPQTMIGNIIYNMISAMESIGPENIKYMIAKGDDNLVWVKPQVDRSIVTHKMSNLFNLEVKLITGKVWYFSSGYVVPLDDALVFVPDPLKIVELLGETKKDPKLILERFVSFQDRINSYLIRAEVPRILTLLVRQRLDLPDLDVLRCINALVTLSKSYSLFVKLGG